ncbi:MAG TPA: hypothetical protein VEB19_10320 [Gemmatimonadaceae bacterium]|nr:hypothetical protein [Gemmatimonadaceae bacterium]
MKRPILVTLVLSTLGAAAGAIAAPLLSFLATTVAQASLPEGRVGYFFDPSEFAVAGAIGIPILAWLLMRRVPLWRAISEPTIGAGIGLLAALVSIPFLHTPPMVQPICILAGMLGAATRLRYAHRTPASVETQPVGDAAAAS